MEEQRLFELNSSLSFLQPNNIYHNYFKTIMERAILTSNGNESYSPPHAPSASTIPFQFDAQPISFKISSKPRKVTKYISGSSRIISSSYSILKHLKLPSTTRYEWGDAKERRGYSESPRSCHCY